MTLCDELMGWLEAKEGVAAHHGRDPDKGLRAQILRAEGRWAELFAAMRQPARYSAAIRVGIARSLPENLLDQRVALMRGLDEQLLTARSPYRSELAPVQDIAGLLGALERQRWIDGLAVRYTAKRNFVKGLAELAG